MKKDNKISLSFSDDEVAILDSIARQRGLSRSEVARNFVLYHGMCGGDFPFTSRILNLPSKDQERVIKQIRENCEAGKVMKPQAFKKWVQEVIGADDDVAMEKAADALLRKLLE